jgi:hypothetical protein
MHLIRLYVVLDLEETVVSILVIDHNYCTLPKEIHEILFVHLTLIILISYKMKSPFTCFPATRRPMNEATVR